VVVRKSLADERVGGVHFGHIRVRVGSKSTNGETMFAQRWKGDAGLALMTGV
jgi:hypothetical protein